MKQSLKDKTKARIVIYAKFAVRRVQQKVERLRSKNQLENYRQTDSMRETIQANRTNNSNKNRKRDSSN